MTVTPFTVTADLADGFAAGAPWGISLDGLLAAEIWARHKEHERGAGRVTEPLCVDVPAPDLDLPLERCDLDPVRWHWAATFAWPGSGLPEPQVHHWTSRVDDRHLHQVATHVPSAVDPSKGRYRNRYMPLIRTVTTRLTWRGVGDVDLIRDLLAPVVSIGKKRRSGQGHVVRWRVEPDAELDPWAASHLHPDHTLGRTAPAACLAAHDVDDGGTGTAGLRPPYFHPQRQYTLHLPTNLDDQ